MGFAQSLKLIELVQWLPASARFDPSLSEWLTIVLLLFEHSAVRQIAVVRDREDLAPRSFLVIRQPGPQRGGVAGGPDSQWCQTARLVAIIAEDDIAMEVLAGQRI